jgi:hypothetical protein
MAHRADRAGVIEHHFAIPHRDARVEHRVAQHEKQLDVIFHAVAITTCDELCK